MWLLNCLFKSPSRLTTKKNMQAQHCWGESKVSRESTIYPVDSSHKGLVLWKVCPCIKQHFDARFLMFYNPSPPRIFLSLDFLSEYQIQHGAIGPLYVTSSYSTWIFCRWVSGFATEYPCDIWCRGLTTCLLHVGPPFGNQILNTSWAVGLTYWIVYLHFFFVFWHMQLYMSWYIISLLALSLLLKYSSFFKYSCTNIFHRRSLCTFYQKVIMAYW